MRVQRIHEPASPRDGLRILVDRLWPRGVSKEAAALDHWARELAPSDALRRWYGHDPARWERFVARYFEELDAMPEVVAGLRRVIGDGPATLLFAAKEEQRNNAVALRRYLERERARGEVPAPVE